MNVLATNANGGGGVGSFNLFGYVPSLAAAGVFIAVFGLLTLIHLGLLVRSRKWWLCVISIGGIAEIIGWIGRVLASRNPNNLNYFLIQIICLILGPCFFSAAVYGILGMLIHILGRQYSRLPPTLYMWIFCLADLTAIVVQAVGGALAALALQRSKASASGTHIMVAGIALQLGFMMIFSYLAAETIFRAKKGLGDFKNVGGGGINIPRAVFGLGTASLFIIVRCIYRTVELGQGWSGYAITHEAFITLDVVPMVFTMAVLVYAHPLFCLLSSGSERRQGVAVPLDSPLESESSKLEKQLQA